MRLIKAFLIGITGLFIIITLLSLLLPFDIKVSRAVVVSTTTGKAYAQIADFRNWKNWEPMFASDSTIKTFHDTTTQNESCDISYGDKKVHLAITSIDSNSVKFVIQEKGENDI